MIVATTIGDVHLKGVRISIAAIGGQFSAVEATLDGAGQEAVRAQGAENTSGMILHKAIGIPECYVVEAA